MRATLLLLSIVVAAPLGAQHASHEHVRADSAFDALQRRGAAAMGVDQHASTHRFDTLRDGGRIALQADGDDAAAVAAIRAHFRTIAAAFARGDFAVPGVVHAGAVPGAGVMAAKRAAIVYTLRDVPRGAELRLRTADPAARRAIAEFMAFQRREHRAGGVVTR
jgi:hypothetical protein